MKRNEILAILRLAKDPQTGRHTYPVVFFPAEMHAPVVHRDIIVAREYVPVYLLPIQRYIGKDKEYYLETVEPDKGDYCEEIEELRTIYLTQTITRRIEMVKNWHPCHDSSRHDKYAKYDWSRQQKGNYL
jgi:hypothetical protein